MTLPTFASWRRLAFAAVAVAAAVVGATASVAEAAPSALRERVPLHPPVASRHARASAGRAERHLARARRPRRRGAGVALRAPRRGRAFAAVPAPRYAPAGLPAGYASDESAYDVGAKGGAFDTGAFYGCLHTVMTAGGYRPATTCE